MTRIVTTLLMPLLAYLIGAFVAADFNINEWGADGRASVAALGFILTAGCCTFPDW